MGTDFNLVASWQSAWAWILASTPPQTPYLIAAIGICLAGLGLWRVASGSSTGGGKRAGGFFILLFLIITLAPGPVVSAILYFVELLLQVVLGVLSRVTA